MSERLTKRQLKRDRFLEIVQESLAYGREHVLVVVVALLVFLGGVMLAVHVAGQAAGPRVDNPEAERALAAARTEFAMGRMDAGRDALDQVRTRFGRSRAAREATYVLANAYYEAGDWARAAATFEVFLKKPLYDDLLRDGARYALAACKEEEGDLAAAYEAYRALVDDAANPAMRLTAGMSAARCARTLSRTDEARTLYQDVLDGHPNTPAAQEARFALAGLESPAG